jgi:CheY-like chemotaxis protein
VVSPFNNLLQGIAGNLDLIRRKPGDAAKVLGWSEAGLKAAERGTRLTSQLLAFSRIQKLELKPFDVTRTIVSFLEMLQRSIEPTIPMRIDFKTKDMCVLGDPVQLELAILNLALNARDAMPEGGELVLNSRPLRITHDAQLPEGDYVELSVIDTGIGMPPETLERAFEPFFTTKEIGKGTGLGLSQVYGAITQSGGAVRIESSLETGTAVHLYLRRTDAAPVEAPVEYNWMRVPASGATILVVDDDKDVRSFLEESLSTLGYVGIIKDNGEEALAELGRIHPDAMIVDFAMPSMNGAEVARKARAIRADLPIIFASGYSETAAVRAAMNENSRALQKPFRVDELQLALQEVLNKMSSKQTKLRHLDFGEAYNYVCLALAASPTEMSGILLGLQTMRS